MMVYSIFLYPIDRELDIEPIEQFLGQQPDVVLDPLGTGIYLICGLPEAKEVYCEDRIANPSEFPSAVLVTVKPDSMNVFQEYGDETRLRSARNIVRWVIEHNRCRVEDEYHNDWTERVARQGVGILYPEQLT